MDVLTTVSASGSLPLERYAHVMNRTFPDVMREAGRGVVRRAMGITPPGNDPGRDGGLTSADKFRGEGKIARDLSALFVPVRLKNKRRERWPNPYAIHRSRFISRSRWNGRLTRGQASLYYVDVRKLRPLVRTLFDRVGRLAAGWVPAASSLKVSVPSWVSRHGASRGSVEVNFSGPDYYVRAVNHARKALPEIVAETNRRIPYALRYQANAMQRSMLGYLSRLATESGLASSITTR